MKEGREIASGYGGKPPSAGRPPRSRTPSVDERILDAAQKIFLNEGFEGASIDRIAEAARAGKPTIYARYPHKQALFAAAVERMIRANRDAALSAFRSSAASGARARLEQLARLLLDRILTAETIGLIRMTIGESRRFPDLASGVYRTTRVEGVENIARLLGELALDGELKGLPAFASPVLHETAWRFADLTLVPLLLRAMFGEPLTVLQRETPAHVTQAVAFFLSACRGAQPAPSEAGKSGGRRRSMAPN